MVCIQCGHETRVTNSRPAKRGFRIWRRRHCPSCGTTFTTLEAPNYEQSWLVRGTDGSVDAFQRDKLFLSLYNALRHRDSAVQDAGDLCDTIIDKIAKTVQDGVVEAASVRQACVVALQRFDSAASVQYQAFHRG